MKVTQQQIADRAGVTRATVSYVLSGRAAELKISDGVAGRVREIADELGYVPNHAAQVLARGRSMTLGLLLGDAQGNVAPFWSPIAEGIQATALASGYDLLLISARSDPETFGLSYLRQGRADALIALGQSARQGLAAWSGCPTPPVVLRPMGPEGLPAVQLDPTPGMQAAVRHLADMGHRHLIWVGPTEGLADRGMSASHAAVEHGAAFECIDLGPRRTIQTTPADVEIGDWLRRMEEHLPSPLPATALLCWNDRVAIAARALLAHRGLAVPGDVSIVGFDDIEAASCSPALSTVSHEFQKLGEAATDLALRIADGDLSAEEARDTVVKVPARFIIRGSTGPAPTP